MRYKNELNIFTYGYRPLTYWKNWFTNIGQFFRNIKFAFQRAYRGYADCDAWAVDVYLSNLIPEMLLHLAKNGCSYPTAFQNREEWEVTLEEISEHFHNTLEWKEDIPTQKAVMDAFDKMNSYRIYDNSEIKKYTDEDAYMDAQSTWLELEQKARAFQEDEKNLALDMLKIFYFDMWD